MTDVRPPKTDNKTVFQDIADLIKERDEIFLQRQLADKKRKDYLFKLQALIDRVLDGTTESAKRYANTVKKALQEREEWIYYDE